MKNYLKVIALNLALLSLLMIVLPISSTASVADNAKPLKIEEWLSAGYYYIYTPDCHKYYVEINYSGSGGDLTLYDQYETAQSHNVNLSLIGRHTYYLHVDSSFRVHDEGNCCQWDNGSWHWGSPDDLWLYSCKVCGQTSEVNPHTHNYEVAEIVEATCTAGGYTLYQCTCGDSYQDNIVAPLGHKYITDKEVPATCTDNGKTSRIYCGRCGEVFAEATIIPALGHQYINGFCTRCGAQDPATKDPCEGYTDINRTKWYHSAVDFMIERGIMGSTQTNALTFEPNTVCTRSMIVSILYRLSGSPKVTYEAKFPDVKAGKWFSDAVIWAYQNGIVSGYGNGYFGPNDQITREQMAVILKGYAEFKGKDTNKIADLSDFPDCAKVKWSKAAVRWAVAEGLISGKAQGSQILLDPQGNATRAEVASILMRFIQNIVE